MTYTVEVCDASFNALGLLRDQSGLTMVHRFCDVGTGKVDCSASAYHRSLIGAGSTVLVRRDGVVEQAGLLEFGESQTSTAGAGTIRLNLNWSDPLRYLAERLVYPSPAAVTGVGASEWDARTGPTSTVILGFVAANAGESAALPDRRVPGLGVSVGADLGVGAYLTAAVLGRYDTVLPLIQHLALAGGVGFRVRTVDRQHFLDVTAVADRSGSVVFDPARFNVTSIEWSRKAPTATHVLAAGAGEGAAREVALITSVESLEQATRWGRRVELFHDAGKATGAELAQAGERVLSEHGETIEVQATATDATGSRFGVDFALGDFVGVTIRPGETVAKPVREVTVTPGPGDTRAVRLLIGDYQATSGTNAAAVTREALRVVRALSRTR